jgi:C1A family cysteine protease
LAANHLTDLTDSEIGRMRGRFSSKGYNGGSPFSYTSDELSSTPASLDWRLYGAVTPVKDQASCGSCWSFGTVGTLEGANFLNTGDLVRFSQQSLMDCSWGFGNNGCDGGEDFRVYQFMLKHGGIPTEDSYGPYLGNDGFCHMNDSGVEIGFQIKEYVNVTSANLDAVKVAMAKHGPLSVGIDASHKSLSFYSSGVYYEPKCDNTPDGLDHAVLAVGYGEINGQKYWLVKNSWSTHWGNAGYVLMSQKDNNCGVATAATYVIPK